MSAVLSLAACSKAPAPPQPTSNAAPPAIPATPTTKDPNVLQAALNAGQIPTRYAAYFDGKQLARIVESRQAGSATLEGEYAFQGARLLHYRGAKLHDAAQLELQFDLQGAVLKGQGPDVSDAEVSAIRNRAQLLRSHALAQRATRDHAY